MTKLRYCASLLFITIAAALQAQDAESRAVRALTKLGGEITLDQKKPEKPVIGVLLRGREITDAALWDLDAFPRLRTLELPEARITDAGLKEIAGVKELQSLDLSHTRITDAGLKHLAPLEQLQ